MPCCPPRRFQPCWVFQSEPFTDGSTRATARFQGKSAGICAIAAATCTPGSTAVQLRRDSDNFRSCCLVCIEVSTWVWERSRSKGTARLVLLALAERANRAGECYPGVDDLARRARVDRRNVQKAIRQLVELGELSVDRQGGRLPNRSRRYQTNLYRVVMAGHGSIVPGEVLASGAAGRPPLADSGMAKSSTRGGDVAVQGEAVRPPEPSEESPENPSAGRDELFSAVALACGMNTGELTPTGSAALNRAVRELAGIGATPDAVPTRARAYRAQWPSAALTPNALLKHWAQLGTKRGSSSSGSIPVEDLPPASKDFPARMAELKALVSRPSP